MSIILATLTTLFLFPGSAVSEISYPNCTAGSLATYPWLLNSLGQGPCAVAVYLESTCWGGSFSLPPLPPGYHYGGPDDSNKSDLCMCNTVMYSLISACGLCQGSPQWSPWANWMTNCTAVEPPASFPNLVPAGTVVHQWALIDVTVEGYWDPNKSLLTGAIPGVAPGQQIGAPIFPSPAGTPVMAAKLIIVTPTTYPLIPSMYPTSSPSPTPSPDRTSDTGVIVGGVVGGIALIGIVIASIVYIRRWRNESPYATSSAYVAPNTPFVVDVSQQSPTEHEGEKALSDDGTLASSSMPDSPATSMKVYNLDM